jgi:hypothetical protein
MEKVSGHKRRTRHWRTPCGRARSGLRLGLQGRSAMEQRGRKPAQLLANRRATETAQTSRTSCHALLVCSSDNMVRRGRPTRNRCSCHGGHHMPISASVKPGGIRRVLSDEDRDPCQRLRIRVSRKLRARRRRAARTHGARSAHVHPVPDPRSNRALAWSSDSPRLPRSPVLAGVRTYSRLVSPPELL